MTKTQEVLRRVLDARLLGARLYPEIEPFMCHALNLAVSERLITAQDRDCAKAGIELYMKLLGRYNGDWAGENPGPSRTMVVNLDRAGLSPTSGYIDWAHTCGEAFYRDWDKRPKPWKGE